MTKAQDQRSHSMKEQAYNTDKVQEQDSRTQRKDNLKDLALWEINQIKKLVLGEVPQALEALILTLLDKIIETIDQAMSSELNKKKVLVESLRKSNQDLKDAHKEHRTMFRKLTRRIDADKEHRIMSKMLTRSIVSRLGCSQGASRFF
ncbi:hypothetical protein Tco_1531212 [Tanacetum coccineum]